MHDAALVVESLQVEIQQRRSAALAVDNVSFTVGNGEVVCLVGESGCGKTLTALSIMRLLPEAAQLAGGRVLLGQDDLTQLREDEMRRRRGADVSMIFQEPMTALDPSFAIGYQLTETYLAHESGSKAAARARAAEMLDLVGIAGAEQRLGDYPHQFSGGMRQRIMIAMALMLEPNVLIADEPTTALDVTIQAQILELILGLRDKLGMSVLLITHDLGVVNEVADRVVVMYAGEVVESARASDFFANPRHPYAQGLLRSMPGLTPPGQRLPVIRGRVPDLFAPRTGCRFAPRCDQCQPDCQAARPPLERVDDQHELRCYHPRPFAE